MKSPTIKGEALELERAINLIKLHARLQVLVSEVKLSRSRLLKLYTEIHSKSPPKGLLPFSINWFLERTPNIHSSLFLRIYDYFLNVAGLERVDAIVKSYRMYTETTGKSFSKQELSITRAWQLLKFVDAKLLLRKQCRKCLTEYITREKGRGLRNCGLCEFSSKIAKCLK